MRAHNAPTGNALATHPRFYICQVSLEFMIDAISVCGSTGMQYREGSYRHDRPISANRVIRK